MYTLNSFIHLATHHPNFKSSCITTNYEELLFSVIRGKYPHATVKQFCQGEYCIFLILHASDEVRGFSLPDIPLTDHYNGMNMTIKEIPQLPNISQNPSFQKKDQEKIQQG